MLRTTLTLLVSTLLALAAEAQREWPREFPEEQAFRQRAQDLVDGTDDGFAAVRGRLSPVNFWITRTYARWSAKPLEAALDAELVDLEGRRHHVTQFPDAEGDPRGVQATYYIHGVTALEPDQERALLTDFEQLAQWLPQPSGWSRSTVNGTPEDGTSGSHSATLTSLKDANRYVSLILRLGGAGAERFGSLELTAVTTADLEHEEGDGAWIVALDEELEPAVDLPALPDNLGEVVLGLAEDSVHSFATHRATVEPVAVGRATPQDPQEYFPDSFERWPVRLTLDGSEDPRALHTYITGKMDWSPPHARMRLLRVEVPSRGTRRAVRRHFDQAADQLRRSLTGWREHRIGVADAAGEGGYSSEYLVRFDGIRADDGPVWAVLQEVSWLKEGFEEVLELYLMVGAELDEVVGFDMRAEFETRRETEPLATAVRLLGDPFPIDLRASDRVTHVDGEAPTLLGLYGAPGANEVRVTVARDGAFVDLLHPTKTLGAAEFFALFENESISPGGLAFLTQRLHEDVFERLLDGLLLAARSDFGSLPDAPDGWLRSERKHELLTTGFDLFRSEQAAPLEVVTGFGERIRAHLGLEYGYSSGGHLNRRIGDPPSLQVGFLAYERDRFSTGPRITLVHGWRDEEFVIALQVETFSQARLAAGLDSHGIWFEPLEGDCANGWGRAYLYREGSSYIGQFVDGLPHGEGRVRFDDGSTLDHALFERGYYMGQAWVAQADEPTPTDATPSLLEDWPGLFASLDEESTRPAPPEKQWHSYFETCTVCWGTGSVWVKRSREVQPTSMAFAGTRAWRQGYTHVHVTSTAYTETWSEEAACAGCGGLGSIEKQGYW